MEKEQEPENQQEATLAVSVLADTKAEFDTWCANVEKIGVLKVADLPRAENVPNDRAGPNEMDPWSRIYEYFESNGDFDQVVTQLLKLVKDSNYTVRYSFSCDETGMALGARIDALQKAMA